DAVSGQFGKQVELKDIAVSVKISEPAADTVKIVEDTADKNNYQIIVKPIEFEITCSSGSKTVEVSKFSAYVERIIAIPEGVDPSKITTGVILNSDGTFSHVPTVITMIDGKYYAKINSLTNSAYLLIYSPKTFQDVKNHWAQKDIYDMASRLIISGVGNDLFEPERSITRAEFSAVMVRALGLRAEEYKNDFFDVKAGEWYSEYISTLSSYGFVRGYDDGIFKPDGNITRQEAMAILARAMDTTKLGEELAIDASHILAAFNDNADVSGWAKDSVSKCVKTGVVTGRDNGRIAPLDNITRAETTTMVRRLLLNSDLINE
ncbi:MAG: S-layer homology domain-containing protein, partial [Methanocorpusculum sp.]|nr:S-layer homology domain-containing protein [Methanocorpusculum sp.]